MTSMNSDYCMHFSVLIETVITKVGLTFFLCTDTNMNECTPKFHNSVLTETAKHDQKIHSFHVERWLVA